MEFYIESFKMAMAEMEKYEALANEAAVEMLADPLNTTKEHIFDVYYTKEFNNWQRAVELLKMLIRCDDNTAKAMIATKRNEINSLLARLA